MCALCCIRICVPVLGGWGETVWSDHRDGWKHHKRKEASRTKRVLSSKEKPCGSSLCADNSSCTDGEQHTHTHRESESERRREELFDQGWPPLLPLRVEIFSLVPLLLFLESEKRVND